MLSFPQNDLVYAIPSRPLASLAYGSEHTLYFFNSTNGGFLSTVKDGYCTLESEIHATKFVLVRRDDGKFGMKVAGGEWKEKELGYTFWHNTYLSVGRGLELREDITKVNDDLILHKLVVNGYDTYIPNEPSAQNYVRISRQSGCDYPGYFLVDPNLSDIPVTQRPVWMFDHRIGSDVKIERHETVVKDFSWDARFSLVTKHVLSATLEGILKASSELTLEVVTNLGIKVHTETEVNENITLKAGMVAWKQLVLFGHSGKFLGDQVLRTVYLDEGVCPGPNSDSIVRIDGSDMTWREYRASLPPPKLMAAKRLEKALAPKLATGLVAGSKSTANAAELGAGEDIAQDVAIIDGRRFSLQAYRAITSC